MHRKTCYGLFGLGSAASAALLWWGPATPWTYVIGYSGYAFAAGHGYACFSALVLEVLGRGERGAAPGYAFLFFSGNVPVLYMTWLDGIGDRFGGARGLMMTDALAGGIGALVRLGVARHALRHWPHLNGVPEPAPAKA